VETVTWKDAVAYCNWLTERTPELGPSQVCYDSSLNLDITKKGLRLPTETEWEYAYRAYNTANYYWGNIIDDSKFRYNTNEPAYAGYGKGHPRGLCDMSGNISLIFRCDRIGHGCYTESMDSDLCNPCLICLNYFEYLRYFYSKLFKTLISFDNFSDFFFTQSCFVKKTYLQYKEK